MSCCCWIKSEWIPQQITLGKNFLGNFIRFSRSAQNVYTKTCTQIKIISKWNRVSHRNVPAAKLYELLFNLKLFSFHKKPFPAPFFGKSGNKIKLESHFSHSLKLNFHKKSRSERQKELLCSRGKGEHTWESFFVTNQKSRIVFWEIFPEPLATQFTLSQVKSLWNSRKLVSAPASLDPLIAAPSHSTKVS